MAARKRSRRKEQAPGWIWMLFGLSVGLAVALYVYLQNGGPSIPASVQRETTPVVAASPPVTPQQAAPAQPAPAAEPEAAAEPDTAAEPEPEESTQTRLGFYEMLETVEVSVPRSERTPVATNSAPVSAPQVLADAYTMQAGSFQTAAEADSRRAQLALLAIDSHVESAVINNQLWHRVIVGPADYDAIMQIRQRLDSARIDTMRPQPTANPSAAQSF